MGWEYFKIRQREVGKDYFKKAGHVVGKPLDNLKTLYEKRLYRKLRQIVNDPIHPMKHYFDSRHYFGSKNLPLLLL